MENKDIKLDGFGINRTVYKDGVLFAQDVNWGIENDGSIRLAKQLVKELEAEKIPQIQSVVWEMVKTLPATNFSVMFHVENLLEDVKANLVAVDPVHYYTPFNANANFKHKEPHKFSRK
jgi:hypothetical protein